MLAINITWEYFLGIFGTLIALAYYANGRLTRLETNFDWLADTVRDLTIRTENLSTKAFEVGSPVSLTATGEQLLRDSGLKSYIDHHKDDLTARLRARAPHDAPAPAGPTAAQCGAGACGGSRPMSGWAMQAAPGPAA